MVQGLGSRHQVFDSFGEQARQRVPHLNGLSVEDVGMDPGPWNLNPEP